MMVRTDEFNSEVALSTAMLDVTWCAPVASLGIPWGNYGTRCLVEIEHLDDYRDAVFAPRGF
jgi:hypothetical protein